MVPGHDDTGVTVKAADLAAGANNLVSNCAGIVRGQRIVIAAENPALGWFDEAAPRAAAAAARRVGAETEIVPVGGPEKPPSPEIVKALRSADVAIFFARIGDQDRFVETGDRAVRVVSYARTATALASDFGRRDHGDMLSLKRAVDRALMDAERIEITCPLGTRLAGPGPDRRLEAPDVAVRRFPMCVPAPVSAKAFTGEVVIAGYLTPTGSRVYDPPYVVLPEPVTAMVRGGRIAEFHGEQSIVEAVEAHYSAVSSRFGIDAGIVHSWHAGIHDGCGYEGCCEDDPDLWSNTVFGSPRFLHFHTCGDYPPGEICWMIEAPTIVADGRAIWQDGVLTV